jgi:L,D-transpeptidase YcbB
MMPNIARKPFALSAAAFAALIVFGAPDANAQGFFDRLFGGGIRERHYTDEYPGGGYLHERPRRERYRQERAAPPPAPTVSAPSYYTYKADPLVAVDFKKLAAAHARARETSDAVTNSVVPASAAGGEQPNAAPLGEVAAESDAEETFADAIGSLATYDLYAEKDIAEALLKHYQEKPDFVWIKDGAPSDRALSALEVLSEAASHGFAAEDYTIGLPDTAALNTDEAVRELARFEMALSARVLRYVRDAHRGRVDPNRISGYHDFAQKPLDYGHVLAMLADTDAVRGYLESWHPQNEAYKVLRAELETLQASMENAIVVAPDTFLRPGQSSPEFAKILKLIERDADAAFLAEHGATLTAVAGTENYSQELVPLIQAAQQAKGLKPDGVIGPRTVAAIAGNSKADRVGKVLVAMEQLRWLPSKLADRHVFINVPEFQARYIEGGEVKLAMRTVVGKTSTQTFFFQDQIEYVEFHPYWGIPRSILVNKYLPKLYQDPGYLDAIGYEITDSRGRRVSSSSINWPALGTNIPFDVRQPPGQKNSLGEMKIMFPNRHAIYMHDTPEKHLFDRENRAQSNGCVRLQDPRGMAAAVLGWTREQVAERLKGAHGQVDLKVKVPVYVVYFTAWPQADGTIAYSPDVYGRDAYVEKAMRRVEEARAPSA